MNPRDLQAAWVSQAQKDAERGVLECRMCRTRGPLDEAITLWKNGTLLFALCARCTRSHDVLIRNVERGVEVRAKGRGPLLLGGT
jgi:hypothetical protein